jgi:hypothetical protein
MKYLALLLAGSVAVAAAAPTVSREQAEAFQKKLAIIVQQGESKSTRERQTILTEGEVNSYLRYSAGDQLPVGVTEPTVAIQGDGRLSGRAIVDLDVVRRTKGSGGWFDPLSYLRGRLPLTASGVLQTKDGKGRFMLETAAVSGLPIPKTLLQEIVAFYSRNDDFPSGINIDDPFDLPAEINRIEVGTGQAVVVQ